MTTFPGYEVVAELGRGGMGVVYSARAATGQRVAIKALLPNVSDPQLLARFEREQRVQGELGDGFVPLLGSGMAGEVPYFVMPLFTKGTLRDRMKRGPLGVEETLLLARALAAALGRAHGRGVVHRDLKPENVLFADDGRPLVGDLGLARVLTDRQGASLTQTREALGTVGYGSPEQLEDGRDATPASDVFALGVILYECLAGTTPYPATSLVRYIEGLRGGRFVPLRRVRRDVPQALADAIERAIQPTARLRAPDAVSFGRELAVSMKTSAARRWLLGAGGALLVLLAVAIGGVAIARRPSVEEVPTPPAPPPPPLVSAPPRRTWPIAEKAHAAAEALRWREAHSLVLFSFAFEPPCAIVYFARARVLFAVRHDLDGTLADLDRALALDPKLAGAYGLRGMVALERRDLDTAALEAERALALDPDCTGGIFVRIHTLWKQNEKASALAEADRLLRLAPRSIDAHEVRYQLFREAGRDEEALAAAKTLFELAPRDPKVVAALGDAHLQVGHMREACDAYTLAQELNPRHQHAWSGRGHARFAMSEISGALDDATNAVRLEPTDVAAWTLVAVSSSLLGRTRESDEAFARAFELDPDSVDTYLARVRVMVSRGQARRALEDANRAFALDPRAPEVLAWRATAHLALDDTASALRDAEDSIKLMPPGDRHRTAYIVRATIREAAGDRAGALADYERVLDGIVEDHAMRGARARAEALRSGK